MPRGPGEFRRGSLQWLDQLDAVAEWISELESVVAGEGDGFEDFDAGRFESSAPGGKVANFVGEMGLSGLAIDAIFGAHMDLEFFAGRGGEPEPAPGLEGGGFFDLG
jgi:hypothetical protein